jgi:RNA polymerase sigma-70 factor (ECF subfamily)
MPAEAGKRSRGIAARDLRVAGEILESILPSITSWAHGRLPRRARRRMETGDLVQEAAVGALEHLPAADLERPAALRSYLKESIRNRIVDELRRSSRVEIGDDGSREDARDASPSPLDASIDSEDRRRFRTALLSLDEQDQLLVVGRVDLELTYRELAIVSGSASPDAARIATRRAVFRLALAMRAPNQLARA